jgi:hypothetical protein
VCQVRVRRRQGRQRGAEHLFALHDASVSRKSERERGGGLLKKFAGALSQGGLSPVVTRGRVRGMGLGNCGGQNGASFVTRIGGFICFRSY